MTRCTSLILSVPLLLLGSPVFSGGLFSSSNQLRSMFKQQRSARLLKNLEERQSEVSKSEVQSDAYRAPVLKKGSVAQGKARRIRRPARPASPRPLPRQEVGKLLSRKDSEPPPPRRRSSGETEVYSIHPKGDQVTLPAAELKRLGPPEAPPPTTPPASLKDFAPGRADLILDMGRGTAELRWDFRKLCEDAKRLRLAPPAAVRHLELDGAPAPLTPEGDLLIEKPGAHRLAMIYAAEIRGNSQWGGARVWTPATPLIHLEAELRGKRLIVQLPGARNLRTEERPSGTHLEALLPPSRSVDLSWEARGATLTPGPAPVKGSEKADLSGEALTVYTIDGPDLRIRTALRWNAGPPGVNRLRVHIPAEVELLTVTQADGKPWPRLAVRPGEEGQELVLGLPARQAGTIQARLSLAARPQALAQLGGESENLRLPLPRVRPLEVGRAPEFLGVVKDPRTRVSLRGPYQAKNRTELPSWAGDLTQGVDGPMGRFQGTQAPTLEIEPLRSIPTHDFRIEHARATTVLAPEDGRALTHVHFQLRNSVEQFLQVQLPSGAELLGATVRGKPVKPGTHPEQEGLVLLALPTDSSRSDREPSAFPVELVYAASLDALRGSGHLRLVLCKPLAPVDRSDWILHHPRGLDLEHQDGPFKPKQLSALDYGSMASGRVRKVAKKLDLARNELLSQVAMPRSNVMNVVNQAPRDLSEANRRSGREVGLLPVEIRLPDHQSLQEMATLTLQRGSVARDSESWWVELSFVRRSMIRKARDLSTGLLVIGIFLGLLSLFGSASRLLGGVLVLAGLGLSLASHGASPDAVEAIVGGILLGMVTALVWGAAAPFRKLSGSAVATALLLTAGSLSATPTRLEVLVPVPEEGRIQPGLGRNRQVLVKTQEIEALREELQERRKPTPPTPADQVLFGDQEIRGGLEDGLLRLEVQVPFRVRGKGPWSLPVVRGDLALEGATLKKGRRPPTPVTLSLVQDRDAAQLDQASLQAYRGYLAGRRDQSQSRGQVGYQLEVPEGSPENFASYLLTMRCLLPPRELPGGGFQVDLELPAASARALDVSLPDDVRVSISGDPRPSLENLTEQTHVLAYPRRQGTVQITWRPRARHVRRSPRPAPRDLPRAAARTSPARGTSPETPRATPALPAEPDPYVLADWEIQLEVGEEQIHGVARADLQVLEGSVDRLTLEVTEAVKVVDVTGPRIAEHRLLEQSEEGARYAVHFQSRRKGNFPVSVRFRLPLGEAGDQPRRTFQAPSFHLLECQDQRGRLGLRLQGSQELRPQEMRNLETLPPGTREVLSYRILSVPYQLAVEVENLPPAPVFPASIVEAKASSQLLSGETRKVTLQFTVENNGRDFLTFRLPEGTTQQTLKLIQVEGRREKVLDRVLDRESKLQVTLPQPPAGQSHPARATFRLELDREAEPPEGWSGSETLVLPIPDLPISGSGLEWSIRIEKGFVLSRLDPRDGRRVPRPFRRDARLLLRGFLPGKGLDGEATRLELEVSYLGEGLMLALFGMVFLGVMVLTALLPLVLLGRVEFGMGPRLVALALIGAGGVGILESGIRLPGELMVLGVALGLFLALALLLWSWRRGATLVALGLVLPGVLSAAPRGLDLHYLTPSEVAARARDGSWTSLRDQELLQLSREAQAPLPEALPQPPATRPPRIRSVSHVATIRGDAARVQSRYVIEGTSSGEWPLVVNLGPDAALVGSRVRRAGKAVPGLAILPEGGPGSPDRGHPRPGFFRLQGFSGRRAYEVELETVLPVIRSEEGGGTFQVSCLPSPGSRFEILLPEEEAHLEVFPSLSTREDTPEAGTRVTGWLSPASTFAVRWTPRSRPQVSVSPAQEEVPEVEPLFDVEVYPSYRLDRRRLHGSHRIRVRVTQGGLDQLRLELPAREELLAVTGPGVERFHAPPASETPQPVEVLFQTKKSGTFDLLVRSVRILGPETQEEGRLVRSLELQGLQVPKAQKQGGDLRLDLPSGTVSTNLTVQGATRVDPREARPPAPPSSLVFRFLAPGVTVGVSLDRLPPQSSSELVGRTGSLRVVPIGDGRSAFVARYTLTSRGTQSLRLLLPEGSSLVSTQVDGRPVKAGRAAEGGEYRIPLSGGNQGSRGRAELQLEFVYIAPDPDHSLVPPALPQTTLENLEIVVSHRHDVLLRAADGPYRESGLGGGFFRPLEEAASFTPRAIGALLTAPVTVPLAMITTPLLVFSGGQAMHSRGMLQEELGYTLSDKEQARFARSPAPPPAPGRARRERRRRKSRPTSGFRQDAPEPMPEGGAAFGDFDDLDEVESEEKAIQVPLPSVAAPDEMVQQRLMPPEADFAEDLLLGEQTQGALPVPLVFHARDLATTTFRVRFLQAGEHPPLELTRLPRWQEQLWQLLALLLAAAGAFLVAARRGATLQGTGILLGGLALGLWLSWSHGAGGELAWAGVLLGLGLGLLDRIRCRWRGRTDDSGAGGRKDEG